MSDLLNSKMAYVVWRVMMKKYAKVRLGIIKTPQLPAPPPVTPSECGSIPCEESWKAKAEEYELENRKSKESSPEELTRTEVRQSTTKRVKKYFKRCKYALSKSSSGDASGSIDSYSSLSNIDKKAEESLQDVTVTDLTEIFEDVCVDTSITNDFSDKLVVANVIDVKATTGVVPENSDYVNVRTDRESENLERVVSENLEPISEHIQELLPKSVVNFESGDTEKKQDEASQSFPLLTEEQERVKDNGENTEREPDKGKSNADSGIEAKCDVASLVDRYFGNIYWNFQKTRKCLVRQARDVLVCEYHGSLQKFEEEFCIPASKLLQQIKNKVLEAPFAPRGWPLSLGASGVVIHLGPLSATLIRNRDCYLCIRNRSAPGLELALVWRKSARIHCQTLAEFKDPFKTDGISGNADIINMCSTLSTPIDIENCVLSLPDGPETELPELLQNLLVSVEHAIERVPLDDLAMPCPHCLMYLPLERQEDTPDGVTCSCQCSCFVQEGSLPSIVKKKDTSIQTSPMFEFAVSIPHIDSDDDDERDLDKNGSSNKKPVEIQTPKRITDLPEKLLMSGINLPGTVDVNGRPIILCYSECIARAGLNKYEIAKLLLYYTSIPSAEDIAKGFTILLLAETCEPKVADTLVKSVALISNNLRLEQFIIWSPGGKAIKPNTNKVKVVEVSEESDLERYISKDQAPASCGGSINHDQLEWVEFFRQYEPFLASCRTSGHALLSALSMLRNEEVPVQVTRRFLNHQCRQISKALQLDSVQKVRKEGTNILSSLEERAQWLSGNRDVKRCATMAQNTYNSVDQVTKRLESLALQRRERLKELARLKTLQDEAEEILKWIRKIGEETLRSQNTQLRSITSSTSVKDIEKSFEKFYFDALRQIDKASDLVEESNNIPDIRGKNLKESANKLRVQAKTFNEKLEDAREELEEYCRCFHILENSQNIKSKDYGDLSTSVNKLGNSKLIDIFKTLNSQKDLDSLEPPDKSSSDNRLSGGSGGIVASSTPIKSPTSQTRRRSVSSHAFIYKCNHHAAGMSCNCYESDTENSVSYKLKKKYLQSLQTCGCTTTAAVVNYSKETLDRKSSLTLDGIKEVRESVENLLEIDKNDSGLSGCGRCDSGVSTAENSVGEESTVYKKKLQRTCSCQFYRESCALCSTGSSSTGSNQDHTENQQDSVIEESSDGFMKSGSDDIEEEHYNEERRKISPISANSHLHCHSSTLHLPIDNESNIDPKTQKTLLFIMREMIQTERDYVNSLDYVIENYIPELMREDIPQALRGQRNVVFGNIEKIYEFHSQHFLRELEQCENNPLQVGQIFLKHDKKFYLYALYNKNKPKSDSLMSEYGGTFFKTKQIQLEDKMDLASYLLKPVQRMGKYALLLQQMMKACPPLPPTASERAISEQEDLKQAEQMVRFQLRHGNDLLAMDSIRECDVNLKEQGRLLRQNEFIVWEGRSGKKSLRQVFLFEELILFSKARRFPDQKNLDLYIYKNSIKMTDIGLTAKIGESPTKFEIWFRKRKPNDTFTLQSMSEDIKKAWAEELSQLLWKQAIRNREVRMAEMSSMGIGNKPCLDIKPSADQISDRSISVAQLSKTAPRFRNSIVGPVAELYRSMKRPHSIISMSSISSSSTSSGSSTSGGNVQNTATAANLSFDSASCDSPKAFHRSGTLNSQCSVESGIIADISLGVDERPESPKATHWPLEKSNSRHSSSSDGTATTTPTQSDDTQVTTIYIVPDDLPVNI